MLVVGLTGGIGSGKSTVSDLFQSLGVGVVDADVIARDVVSPGSTGLNQITQQFGIHLLDSNGGLNRKALRALAFSDQSIREKLECILHPLIRDRTVDLLIQEKKHGAPYCINVVPLLFENQLQNSVGRVLVVDCEEELQLERVMQRDRCSKAEAERILATQASREERLSIADDVIVNNGEKINLADDVKRLHAQYLDSEIKNL